MTRRVIGMTTKKNKRKSGSWGSVWVLAWLVAVVIGCGPGAEPQGGHGSGEPEHGEEAEGPHGGRVFASGDFTLELALIDAADAPVFRAWSALKGEPVPASDVRLELRLSRLGGRVDTVGFSPSGAGLKSDVPIAEPHSFTVDIVAGHAGQTHRFSFEQLEGRTRIDAAMAESLGLVTATAGPARVIDSVKLFGRVTPHPDRVRQIRARFDGVVKRVRADLGARVEAGDELLRIESNESLNVYPVYAPIDGVVTRRDANPGEQTAGRLLVEVTDTSRVLIDLSVYPGDRRSVQAGHRVTMISEGGVPPVGGVISSVEVVARQDQSLIARAEFENPEGVLVPGTFVTAVVVAAEHDVALAVARSALQRFRDFTVVFEQVGDEYEVRMLELGRQDEHWAEVLGGLEPGATYVVGNPHLVKADVEKSGATHDH